MRQILKQARIKAGIKQKETVIAIGVSKGKGHIWDALETLFNTP
jgi:hypothetical protein